MRITIRLATAALAVLMFAVPAARAATLDPQLVFTDVTLDNPTNEDDTPTGGASDLVAGFIGETDTTLTFAWHVADLNKLPSQAPQNIVYYWEFALTAPSGASDQFQVRARLFPALGSTAFPAGELRGQCSTDTGSFSCATSVNESITLDAANNRVIASVKRKDFKKASEVLAKDGATLEQLTMFAGIASCVSAIATTLNTVCDDAAMDEIYTLGTPR